jgi:hypothetical protein
MKEIEGQIQTVKTLNTGEIRITVDIQPEKKAPDMLDWQFQMVKIKRIS